MGALRSRGCNSRRLLCALRKCDLSPSRRKDFEPRAQLLHILRQLEEPRSIVLIPQKKLQVFDRIFLQANSPVNGSGEERRNICLTTCLRYRYRSSTLTGARESPASTFANVILRRSLLSAAWRENPSVMALTKATGRMIMSQTPRLGSKRRHTTHTFLSRRDRRGARCRGEGVSSAEIWAT